MRLEPFHDLVRDPWVYAHWPYVGGQVAWHNTPVVGSTVCRTAIESRRDLAEGTAGYTGFGSNEQAYKAVALAGYSGAFDLEDHFII